ncbi:Fic family protein [candidate division KSB1 bacterium]|nr:Fic family protein [candidate division KSB1 bacterium]
MNFTPLDKLKQTLDSYRPLPNAVVKNLNEDLILRWTYHSNAIEGNTLTLKETKVALEGITIGGKTMREHLEAINHRDAIFYIEELVKTGELLSEWIIKQIHQLILKTNDNKNAGIYRSVNVKITGAEHVPPDHLLVGEKMSGLIDWYKNVGSTLHPVEKAAYLHAEIVGIHPFIDGNGRTARLLMNLELMKTGFPPAVLPVERRLEYYESLDEALKEKNYTPFYRLVFEIVKAGFEPYWFALGIEPDR